MWPFRRKAIQPHSHKSASFFFSLGAGRAGLTGAAYDRIAQEGYVECVVAFACINKIASAVASVEHQLYERGKGRKLVKVESHPLLDLMENPSPAQSGMEFMLELAAYHRLSGNAYVLGNGLEGSQFRSKQPSELSLLSPGKVKIEPGKGFFPARYEFRPDPSTTIDFPVDQVTGRSPVLHLKSFNPVTPWYGLSPISAAALSVDIHSGGQKWNKRLIENGARPSGALVVQAADGKPATLSDDQYQRVKEMIDSQFSGPDNTGRPMLLEGGLDWKEMSLNPKDMDFLEGKHSAARDIALAFGVPPQLVGIPDSQTYSNYSEAKESFWTETVLPLLAWYLAGFNRWLTPLYGDNLYLWFDEEMIPALEGMRERKFNRLNTATFLSMNEKRRAAGYDDYLPSDSPADSLFVESSKVPLEMAGMVDLAEPGSAADKKPVNEPEDPDTDATDDR